MSCCAAPRCSWEETCVRAELLPSEQIERIIALRRFPGFARLRPQELAAIAAFTEARFFPKGSVLTEPGRPSQEIFLLVEGSVGELDGGVEVRRWTGQDAIGGMAALTQDPCGQHYVALEDTEAFSLNYEDMIDVFEDHFSILVQVLGGMSRALLDTRRALGFDAGYEPPAEPERAPHSLARLSLVDKILMMRNQQDLGKQDVEVAAELARNAIEWRYPAGTELWAAGDAADHYLFIVAGCVEGLVPGEAAAQGEPARSAQRLRLGASSSIGIMDAIAAVPRWYHAVAETDVVVLRIEVSDLLDILEDHTELALNMLRMLASTVLAQRRRLAKRGLESARPPPPALS